MRTHLEKLLGKNIRFYCHTPALPAPHPMLTYTLTTFPRKRLTPLRVMYQSHFRGLINSYPHPVTCYTDDSKLKNRTGFVYSIEEEITSFRHRISASILTVKLQTIYQCLEFILSFSPSHSAPYLLCSDSLSSLDAMTTSPMPHSTTRSFNASTLNVTFVWIPGHRGILENENIDKAAKAAALLQHLGSNMKKYI